MVDIQILSGFLQVFMKRISKFTTRYLKQELQKRVRIVVCSVDIKNPLSYLLFV